MPPKGKLETNIVVVPREVNKNFESAMNSLKRYKMIDINSLNVLDLLKEDKIIFT